jgi:hypothetical protein
MASPARGIRATVFVGSKWQVSLISTQSRRRAEEKIMPPDGRRVFKTWTRWVWQTEGWGRFLDGCANFANGYCSIRRRAARG